MVLKGVCMFPTGGVLPTRPSKVLSQRKNSHEENDTTSSRVTPSPTKQEKVISSRLSKQSDNARQNQKSPVMGAAEPSLSMSKLPTRGQRTSNKVKSRKPLLSPAEISVSTTTSTQESSQGADTETTAKGTDGVVTEQLGGKKEAIKENQSSMSESKMEGKEANDQEWINNPETEEILKTLPNQNNNVITTANSEVAQVSKVLPSCEAAEANPAHLPVTNSNKAETSAHGREQEAKQQAQVPAFENVPAVQNDNTTQKQKTPETTLIIGNVKPDLNQEEDPSSNTVLPKDIKEKEDVTDMSTNPPVGDSIHCDIMTQADEEGLSLKATSEVSVKEEVNANNLTLMSEDQHVEPEELSATPCASVDASLANMEQQQTNCLSKDYATNIIPENNLLPSTFEKDSVKTSGMEEGSKEEVGREPPEALDIQTEAVTVCELLKNAENQQDKDSLLLATEIERQEKDSKPNEKLNDAAVESTDSQSSCKEELRGTTIEDKDITQAIKPCSLSSEEKCLQPDPVEGPHRTVMDVLEEKRTETEQQRGVLHATTATVAERKHECETLLKENAKSGSEATQQEEQQTVASTMKHEEESKLSPSEPEVKSCNTNKKGKYALHAAGDKKEDQNSVVDGNQIQSTEQGEKKKTRKSKLSNSNLQPEQATVSPKALDKNEMKIGTTQQQKSLDTKDLLGKSLSETPTAKSKHKSKTAGDQSEDIEKNKLMESKCSDADLKQEPGQVQTEMISENHVPELQLESSETKSAAGAKDNNAIQHINAGAEKTDEDKVKTNVGVKQDKLIPVMNLSDPQKQTKPSINGSLFVPAAAKPSTLSQSPQLQRESPSSWLDVEHHQKQKLEQRKRLNSSSSEDASLEPDDLNAFIRSG